MMVWQTSYFNNQRHHREIRSLARSDRRLTIREMADELNSSIYEGQSILTRFKHASSIRKLLSDKQKEHRLQVF